MLPRSYCGVDCAATGALVASDAVAPVPDGQGCRHHARERRPRAARNAPEVELFREHGALRMSEVLRLGITRKCLYAMRDAGIIQFQYYATERFLCRACERSVPDVQHQRALRMKRDR